MNPVDIIVPIYGAAEDLRRCLLSVLAHTDLQRHGLLLVLDGPQDAAVEDVLSLVPLAYVLRTATRGGFVRTVNHGMRASNRDVLLLNSDTVVTPGWLDQISAAGASADDIGTVTPLSNHAALCSVPRSFAENLLPIDLDAERFAALVERVSIRSYTRLPTAVGFCMWIRRALLQQIGLFDEQNFGMGYGEENDFCMRASAAGWSHICDDATFIEHSGNRSFRAERFALQREGRRTMARLHPGYGPDIARFMAEDPLAPLRQRIEGALREHFSRPAQNTPRSLPRHVVHLVHGWPPLANAGTELYAHGLVRWQLQRREVSVYARIEDPARGQGEVVELYDHGARVRLLANRHLQRNPLARNGLASRYFDKDFARFLREQRADLLHVHHLAGHSFSLVRVARRLGIPVVMQLHDRWALCARVNLLDADGRRCSGPALRKCASCLPLTRLRPARLNNLALHLLRRRFARQALAAADACIIGSQFIHDDYARAGLLPAGKPVHVLPNGVQRTVEAWPHEALRDIEGAIRFPGGDSVNSGAEHADQIEAVYAQVLGRPR